VLFAAYDVPHPLIKSIKLRVITKDTPAKEAIEKAIAKIIDNINIIK
jgi:DNA-directed RNA polymerase subunit L